MTALPPRLTRLLYRLSLIALIITYLVMFRMQWNMMADHHCTDLRNRVVGTRLISDGHSPYYFKWTPLFPETLFDPIDRCNVRNNMITAPPSLLLLMEPLAPLNFATISNYWLIVHYAFLVIIFFPFLYFFKSDVSRLCVCITGCSLLFTSQWEQSVFLGQSHFILPAIISCLILLSGYSFKGRWLLIALLIAFAVWIRPNAILIVPLLFLGAGAEKRQFFISFCLFGLVLLGLTYGMNHDVYWKDFYYSCVDWIKYYSSPQSEPLPCYTLTSFEGRNFPANDSTVKLVWHYSNVLPILRRSIGIRVTIDVLTAVWLIFYIAAIFIVYKYRPSLADSLLWGMLIYWLAEISSVLPKPTYYYLELFPVVLYLAGRLSQRRLLSMSILIVICAINFLTFLPAYLALAEYALMACLCWYLCTSGGLFRPRH